MFAGYQAISRSANGGDDWEMVGGLPLVDNLISAVLLNDDTALFLSQDRLWWSHDHGASYDYMPLPVTGLDMASIGNDIVLLTSAGLQAGSLDAIRGKSTLNFNFSIPALYLKASDTGVAAVSESGRVWLIADGAKSLTEIGTVKITAKSVVIGGSAKAQITYVGDSDGKVWRHQGGNWEECGLLPKSEHPAVVALEISGTRLLAAPASFAPFLSSDNCATWLDRRTNSETEFDNSGGAESDEEAFTVLRAAGDSWIIGGWDGLWLSKDSGISWTEIAVIPADFTRGLAFSPEFPADERVYVGAYAGGIQVSPDAGASFISPNWGIGQPNVQNIRTTPGNPERISAIVAHFSYVSDDGGVNWRELDDPFSMEREVISYVDPAEIWVYAKQPSQGAFNGMIAYSLDDGKTYLEPSELNSLMPMGAEFVLRFTSKTGDLTYMATGADGVFTASSPTGPWTRTMEAPTAGSGGGPAVIWPTVAPERAMFARGSTIFFSDDAGNSWATVAELGPFDEVSNTLFAEDGTAFAVTTVGRIFRSDDGHDWTEMILDTKVEHPHVTILPSQVYEALARPDFVGNREILIGTHDGVYLVTDTKPPTVSRWSGWQIVDNKADFVHCSGCSEASTEPNNETFPGADFNGISRMGPGIEMSLQLRGHTIYITGTVESESTTEVYVDDIKVGILGTAVSHKPGAMITLFTVKGLEDGWHQVLVVGVAGDGVLIDTFEALTEANTLSDLNEKHDTGDTGPIKETGDTQVGDTADSADSPVDTSDTDNVADTGGDPGCGCTHSTNGFLGFSLIIVLFAAFRRERRTPTKPNVYTWD